MAIVDLSDWLIEQSKQNIVWYLKRLSGNDTLANKSHQAGPYIPKNFMFKLFPSIATTEKKNPDTRFDLFIDSHSDHRNVRATYYNNKFHGNPTDGRNETRLTQLGGISSALLDPDNTGALTIFSFKLDASTSAAEFCRVWVCRNAAEEEILENIVSPVEPGDMVFWTPIRTGKISSSIEIEECSSCWLERTNMPPTWLTKFPKAADIVHMAVKLRELKTTAVDTRLLKRRECEYEIFRSIEQALELPNITAGFNTVDEFISRAQTILQRRKARSGRSLELHLREIFIEERLTEGSTFSHQPESERGKSPDFLFPSEAAYKNTAFPEKNLRMLAVKTTCKDRWRQILNEANRIPKKHLLTLQEGVSESQFREMSDAGVQLIVPAANIKSFPKAIRLQLQTLESFINEVRTLAAT